MNRWTKAIVIGIELVLAGWFMSEFGAVGHALTTTLLCFLNYPAVCFNLLLPHVIFLAPHPLIITLVMVGFLLVTILSIVCGMFGRKP